MERSRIFSLVLLIFFTANHAFAQAAATQSGDPHKHQTILTITGAAGGFATGFYIGRAAYDTPDSQRKVWTASAISAAAGGVGGYFIGRAIDKRKTRNRLTVGLDKFDVTPLVSKDTKGLYIVFGF
jgi:membrane protein YqaA with SNARE-associated domain